ncbi:methylated-DNA--[protein]-cysteine S-methyltransferase [Streptomyces sp. NPDC052077]|uniref:methylated-DNA--[protein]-cysteine S-methyltransferase n=1 Tax=Streptomyces sp. NPDC052077 TaxID=3154757 RepID=UPI003412D33F
MDIPLMDPRRPDPRHTVTDSALGPLTVVARGPALTGLYFADHVRRPARETFGPAVAEEEDALLAEASAQLREYLTRRRTAFALPLAAEGDTFQHAVWDLVGTVPRGGTTTYGSIARRLGDPLLAQRVGWAVGSNPLCVLVPCHRVVGADGSLTGYAGGLARKRALLALEEPDAESASRLF